MQIDESQLTPQQQSALMAVLGQSFQPAAAPSQPPSQSVQPVDDMHAAFLQGTGHLPQQPQGALAQAAPTPTAQPQSALAQGANPMQAILPTSQVPAPGQTALSPTINFKPGDATFRQELPNRAPLGKLFGIKRYGPEQSTTNYLDAYKGFFGQDAPLPGNLPVGPDGKPFMTGDQFKQLVTPESALLKASHGSNQPKEDTYNSVKQLTAQGIPKDKAQELFDAFGGKVPNSVVHNFNTDSKLDQGASQFQTKRFDTWAKDLDSNVARIATPNGANQTKLNASEKLFALIDQTKGNPNAMQTPELATAVANLISNGNATVVSDHQIERLLPQSYKGTVKSWLGKLTNEPLGLDQQAFIKSLFDTAQVERDTLQRQMLHAAADTSSRYSDILQDSRFQDRAAVRLKSRGFDDDTIAKMLGGQSVTSQYDMPQQTFPTQGQQVPTPVQAPGAALGSNKPNKAPKSLPGLTIH